jgi:DNA repair exonuclease SbcCD ATPase subunit
MSAFAWLAALGFFTLGHGAALNFDVEEAKNRPVSKVITLLKDMSKQLEKEQAEDEELYDNMACWCTTNDKEKTAAIADAEATIDRLNSKIEELTALSARLGTEIENLKKEKAENEESLAKATSLREKQLSEFNAEEKDLLESIAALSAAITALSKHHGGEFLQLPHAAAKSVANTLQEQMRKHAALLEGVLTHKERRAISAFVQAPQDYFDAAPTFKQSYAPQSGEIFGVLAQMKETFEANLSAAQKEEMAAQKAYEELKAAKEAQIAAAAEAIGKKTVEQADTDEKNSQAKQDLEDTKASLSADQQYLMMLKEKCALTDKEWEERQKTRQAELGAVSKALAVLSGDDAHDLFSRTFSFVQVSKETTTHSLRREQASKLLSAVATKLHSPKLATLAYQVKLDAFTRVKKAIDDMISMLLQEKADEIKHKDFCTDELNTNQLQTEKKERKKQDLIAKIEDLETAISRLAEEIATLKSEIGSLQLELKRVGEDREKENTNFQTTVADQRETQKLLHSALSVLQGFYDKGAAALVQRKQEPVGPPPPPGFKAYNKNAASGGVMAMITQIIEDAEAMEKEILKAEDDAQKTYELFVTETNTSIETKAKEIVHLSQVKAKKEEELVETKQAKEANDVELEQLSTYNSELHTSCDFVLKNFDIRQTARDEEVEALKQAKAILSGANFEQFLQSA